MARITDPEVLTVLRAASCQGTTVVLKSGQLTRDLYVKVNKVLEALGGKWNRKLGGHVFPSDPAVILAMAIEEEQYVDPKREHSFFETPPDLARDLVHLARVEKGMLVLEPSAGKGALVRPMVRLGAKVCAVERNPDYVSDLELAGASTIRTVDFLKLPIDGPIYDRIVMNPPFSEGKKQVDVLHVARAYSYFLKPGGILAAIMSPGWTFRNDAQSRVFREFMADQNSPIINPAGSFKSSGTNVGTVTVVLRK